MKTEEIGGASELFLRIDEEKRGRILAISVAEFAANGYARANVNRIAETAGISVGSLYKYFAAKDDLFMYIVEIAAKNVETYVTEIVTAELSFFAKLEKLLRLAREYSESDPTLIKLYNVFTSENDTTHAEVIAGKLESITAKAYTALIMQAQENGEIRRDIDPKTLAFMMDNQLMVMQFSFACTYYRKRYSLFLGEGSDEQVIQNMMKVFRSVFTDQSKQPK
jgi:AcrR family transcriptional regulator